MELTLATVLLAICTYSTATHHHQMRNIEDVHHFVPHIIEEKVEAVKSFLPHPPTLPKVRPFIEEDHVHHKLKHHYPQHKKLVLPKPIFPLPHFPKIHPQEPHILTPESIVPHPLKPLLKLPLPLPHPRFLKQLPIPIPAQVPIDHPVAPVVESFIPITKHHHDIQVHERIQ